MRDQRKHYYNDRKIQGHFLFELIVMELLLGALLMVYLYYEVNNIIDSHLYQMHAVESTSWADIFNLLGVAMGGFVVVNLLVLYFAHLLWGRYVRTTIELFSQGLDRMLALDFSNYSAIKPGRHRLLDLMRNWLDKERQRNQRISELLSQLAEFKGKPISDSGREQLKQVLDEYRRLLGVEL